MDAFRVRADAGMAVVSGLAGAASVSRAAGAARTESSPAGPPLVARGGLTSEQAALLTTILVVFMGMTLVLVARMRRELRRQQELLREKLKRELEQEKVYRTLFEANPQPMWVYDLETLAFLAVNCAATERYGYSREEFSRLTIKDIRPREDVSLLEKNIAQVTDGLDRAGVWRHCKKDGSIIAVEITSHTLEFAGRRAELVLAHDVTERLRAEGELRASERYRRTLIEAEPECVKVVGPTGELREMNAAGLRMIEADSLAQVERQAVAELVAPEHRPAFIALHRQVMAGGAGTLEFEIIGLRGARRWLETHAVPLRDDRGQITGLLGITRDVTARRAALEELRGSEAKLAAAQRIGQMGNWEMAIAGDDLSAPRAMNWSAEVFRIFGLEPGAPTFNSAEFFQLVHPDDREQVRRAMANAVERRQPYETEHRIVRPDGTVRVVREYAEFLPQEPGKTDLRLRGIVHDITLRSQAEAALRERERAYATLLKNLTGMVYRCRNDADWTTTYVSDGCLALTGYSTAELINNRSISLGALIHPDDAPVVWDKCQRNLAAHKACSNEYRIRTASGEEKWVWDQAHGVYGDTGELLCIEGFVSDITERRRAEAGERESRLRHEALVSSIDGIVWEADARTLQFTFVSQQAERLLGFPVAQWTETGFWVRQLHPDDQSWVPDFCRRSTEQGQNHDFEYRFVAADGRPVWLRDFVTVVQENGRPRWLRGVMVDITHVKAAEEERRRILRTLQLFIDSVPGYVSFVNAEQRYELVNPGYEEWFGRPRDQIVGRRLDEMHPPEVYAAMRGKVESALAGELVRYESEIRSPAGQHHWFDCRYIPRRAEDGRVLGFFVLVMDVTERKEAELAARESRERLDSILGTVAAAVWSTTADASRLLYLNPGAAAIYGRPAADFFARPQLWLEIVYPEDRSKAETATAALVRGESCAVEYRVVRPDGQVRWVRDSAQLVRDAAGQPLRIDGIAADITAIRAAEEERIALERQIQQTQKLESLGVLAGGIAHDFNNLLTAVMGNVSLAMMELPPASPIRQHLLGAERATQRAADLARQMLAYSGKGRFVVQRVNLHEIVEEMLQMLQVSISKKAVLRFNFATQVPAVEADVTQVRQIILNLVINASDAIGDRSGVIAISTGVMRCDRAYLDSTWLQTPLSEGLYSYIEVADSGCGIPRDKLPRIFDPFFTTKFTGRGLGLAAVLGIVRGHKGAIKVYSEINRGTTFKILLPAIAEAAELLPAAAVGEKVPAWRGHGLALLVDDEESIRAIGQHMLERLGFEVITAADGREAVSLFQQRGAEVTVVVLDLTMPHMDGEEAFRELRRLRPDVCVVLSSGYSEQDVVARFAGKGLAGFVPKPYAIGNLEAVLQRVVPNHPTGQA